MIDDGPFFEPNFSFYSSVKQEHVQALKLTRAILPLEFVSADLIQHVVAMNFGDVKTILVRML